MILEAMVLDKTEIKEGTNPDGKSWRRQELIVEYIEREIPRKVALTVTSDRMFGVLSGLKFGDTVLCKYNPESKMYNGKWHTTNNMYYCGRVCG